MNPDMHPDQRHGSVWFDVTGFGEQRRDFVINEPDRLAKNVEELAKTVAQQVMLLDPTLPKRDDHCKLVKIDVVGAGMHRMYDPVNRKFLMEQKLM